MNRAVLKIPLLFLCIFLFKNIHAQSKIFENVDEVKLQKTVTIKNNNAIVGYALFYRLDKMKKSALYRLEILDENLKSIGSNEFEGSKKLNLLSAVYESEHIMLAFTDEKKTDGYEKFVKVFDLKGKETGLVSYDPDKVKKGMFGAAIAEGMDEVYNGYTNVEGKGFVCIYQSVAKTGGVDIQMIDTKGKLKWEKNFTADKGDREDAYLLYSTPNAIMLFLGNRENMMSKDSKNFLLGLDPATGKEIFRKPMEQNSFALEPYLFKTENSGGYKMISMVSHEEDKFYSARPIGFEIAELNDKTGELKTVKNFQFEKDLGGVLDMNTETKSEEGFMRIHDVCPMADGSTVIVGEFFRRTVSALGTAFKVLSKGEGSATQITIGDLFLLRLNKDYKAVSLEKIDKRPSRIPAIADGASLGLTQRIMAMYGYFGYIYTDEGSDPNKRTVIVKGNFEEERYGMNAITFDEKKGYKIKKFNVAQEKKEELFFKRAKPGYLLIQKYNTKTKTITLNLEKTDY